MSLRFSMAYDTAKLRMKMAIAMAGSAIVYTACGAFGGSIVHIQFE
jgi:hypothetical protein